MSCGVIVTPCEGTSASGGAETLDLVVDSGDVDELAAHHIGEIRREILFECLAVLARGMVLALLGGVQHTSLGNISLALSILRPTMLQAGGGQIKRG